MKLNEFVRKYIPCKDQFFSVYHLVGFDDQWEDIYQIYGVFNKREFKYFAQEQFEYLLNLEVLEIGTDANDKLYICVGEKEELFERL